MSKIRPGPIGALSEGEQERILLVEDEFLVGLNLQEDLVQEGFAVLGPFATIREALVAAANEAYDLAILDVNVKGEFIYPVADLVFERNLPVILLTGYGELHVPERLRSVPRIAKPYNWPVLGREITRLLRSESQPVVPRRP